MLEGNNDSDLEIWYSISFCALAELVTGKQESVVH